MRIFGKLSDVWEKLIDLLSGEPRISGDAVRVDQSLVQFFKRFREVLLSHLRLRIKLYRVAKSTEYKQFRRTLFQSISEQPNLLPDYRNDESEIIVQVLAELWDSDCTWIIERQSRCQDLKVLLGQLQAIDAVGARNLADQITKQISQLRS